MLLSCIEHQVHNHSPSFAGPSPFCCCMLAQCGVLNTPTRDAWRCRQCHSSCQAASQYFSHSTWTHGHAVLPTGLSSSLNGNLEAFGTCIGHRSANTHPHTTRAPLPLVSFVRLPGCVFPLLILLSFIHMCESQSSPSEVTSLKIRLPRGLQGRQVLLTSFSSSARCCAPAGLKALNALPADCRLPIVCAHTEVVVAVDVDSLHRTHLIHRLLQ